MAVAGIDVGAKTVKVVILNEKSLLLLSNFVNGISQPQKWVMSRAGL